jgi:threonine dehydrogenase-like Zn-dependent dehydrogenase
MLAEGKVQTRPLVSSTRPLEQWKEAILGMEAKEEMKVVLVP